MFWKVPLQKRKQMEQTTVAKTSSARTIKAPYVDIGTE